MKTVWKCEFEFECPKDWDDMKKTSSETVRFCNACEKDVYFCSNKNELDFHRKKGDCIATYDFFIDSVNKREHIVTKTDTDNARPPTRFVAGRIREKISKGRLKS